MIDKSKFKPDLFQLKNNSRIRFLNIVYFDEIDKLPVLAEHYKRVLSNE